MKIEDIKKHAFAMPFSSPSYPKSEFKFVNREFLVITYETDLDALRAIVPEPLKVINPIVKYEFIRMPDSSGFGDYTESGQVIPVEFNGKSGSYVHSMYLDDLAPIVAGREIWGFPKKFASPSLSVAKDTVLGVLKYGTVPVAVGTMTYKFKEEDTKILTQKMSEDANFLLKIIPHANGHDLSVCQLVRYFLKNVVVKGAWSGDAQLQLFQHALAPVAQLPVKRVISGLHVISDLSLGFGEVVHDYLLD